LPGVLVLASVSYCEHGLTCEINKQWIKSRETNSAEPAFGFIKVKPIGLLDTNARPGPWNVLASKSPNSVSNNKRLCPRLIHNEPKLDLAQLLYAANTRIGASAIVWVRLVSAVQLDNDQPETCYELRGRFMPPKSAQFQCFSFWLYQPQVAVTFNTRHNLKKTLFTGSHINGRLKLGLAKTIRRSQSLILKVFHIQCSIPV